MPRKTKRSSIESVAAILHSRNAAPYDGVLGPLKHWFPEIVQRRFIQARNRLLDAGYKASEVRQFIEEDIHDYCSALATPLKASTSFSFALPVKVRNDVRLLAHVWTAYQMEEVEALAFLTDKRLADSVQIGKNHCRTQSFNASKPRASRVGKNKTIHQIVGEIALSEENLSETASGLWTIFKDVLVGRGIFLQEIEHPKNAWKSRYEYNDERKRRRSITLGTFEKLVSQYRTGRKKLP